MQYFDHRGWPNVFPEETLAAYKASVAAGAQWVEADVQALRDGTLVCMHDSTVDRTTTATGNVSDFSGPGWAQLVVDAGNFLGAGWGNFPAPTLEDVLHRFGNQCNMLLEVKDEKDSTGLAMLAALNAHGIDKRTVIVNSFTPSNLTPFISDGWTCCVNYYTYTGTPTPSDIVASGAAWAAVATTTTTAQMDALRSAGLKVAVFTVDSLTQADSFSAHADAIYTNEGAYLRGSARLTSDPFSNQTWYYGQIKGNGSGGGGGRGMFFAPNQWGLDMSASNSFASTLQGWANPIGGGATCGAMKIAVTVKMEREWAPDRWASLAITTADDPLTSDTSGSKLYGYHFLFVKSGAISIYKLVNGMPSLLETKASGITNIPDGGTASYLITITPTTLKLDRTDVAYSTSAFADSTYRGTMLHAGVKGVFAKFSNIAITEIVP